MHALSLPSKINISFELEVVLETKLKEPAEAKRGEYRTRSTWSKSGFQEFPRVAVSADFWSPNSTVSSSVASPTKSLNVFEVLPQNKTVEKSWLINITFVPIYLN
ncbi:MAG: hypothetical protein AB7S54_07910 [Bacteroidales bacterium]